MTSASAGAGAGAGEGAGEGVNPTREDSGVSESEEEEEEEEPVALATTGSTLLHSRQNCKESTLLSLSLHSSHQLSSGEGQHQ